MRLRWWRPAKIYEYLKTGKGAKRDQSRLREDIEQLIEVLNFMKNDPNDLEVSAAWTSIVDFIDRPDGLLTHLKDTLNPVLSELIASSRRKENAPLGIQNRRHPQAYDTHQA